MNQHQVEDLLARLQGLSDRIGTLEQRMTAVERTLSNNSGPSSSRAATRSNRNGNVFNGAVGSSNNAQFLPFVIEAIVAKCMEKDPGDTRRCSKCNRETYHLDCFLEDHFRWCRIHGRPILHNHQNCGRDYSGCRQVRWEIHPDWDNIVLMSSAGESRIGTKGVNNLYCYLFPRSIFPHKYDRNGWPIG